MTRLLTALVCVLLVVGCDFGSDPSAPATGEPTAAVDGPPAAVQAIVQAAQAQSPLNLAEGVGIGVPESSRSANRAEVLYYNQRVLVRYEFSHTSRGWERGDLLDRRQISGPSSISSGLDKVPASSNVGSTSFVHASGGYSSSIAKLYAEDGSVRDQDWFIPNVTSTGWHFYSEEYQTDLPFDVEFLSGTESSADTTYEARFTDLSGNPGLWTYGRYNDPAKGEDTCNTSSCSVFFTYEDSAGFQQEIGSEYVELDYYLYVQRPVYDVVISGPDSISGVGGDYTWSASADGGDGLGFSYTWEEKPQGGSWSQVGSGSVYTRTITQNDSNTEFDVRVTATSGSESGQAQKHVVVGEISDPLSVMITGPDAIETTGNYTWDSDVSGGTTPYSYEWEHCTDTCTVVSTASSYTRYVEVGDPEFTLRLTVDDSGSGEHHQSETDSHYVYVNQGGGQFGPDPAGGDGG